MLGLDTSRTAMKSGLIAMLRHSARSAVPVADLSEERHQMAAARVDLELLPPLSAQLDTNHKLVKAAKLGKVRRINHQLAKGASVHFRDAMGFTPLLLAVMHGHLGAVSCLLHRGADINAQTKLGVSALHLATLDKDTPMMALLMGKRIRRDLVTTSGLSALHSAAEVGFTEGAALLVLGQASGKGDAQHYFPPMHPAVFNQPNGGGQTALAVAALHNRAGLVELLLRNGAVHNTLDDLGHTAHDIARMKGNAAAVEKLETFNVQAAINAANRRAEGQKAKMNPREQRKMRKEEKAALLRQKRLEMG